MFGDNIRKLRTMRGLTQKELADALNFSYQNISKWENDISMPDIPTVLAIANYFGVSVDTLLGNTPKNENLEIPVAINAEDDFCLWTDFVYQDTTAPLSALHENRRRTGTGEKDFAAEPRICFFLAVNAEHKISGLISYRKHDGGGGFFSRIRNHNFYHRPNEHASFFLPNAETKLYDILVPKDGFLITADSMDHRAKQILSFVLPKDRQHFLSYPNYVERGVYWRTVWQEIFNGELDHVDVFLEGDRVRFTKPLEYVNPLYDNVDHLTSLVKERVALSLREYQEEIHALENRIAELESELEDVRSDAEDARSDAEDARSEMEDLTERIEAHEEKFGEE